MLAALHVFVAEIEGRRGMVDNVLCHALVAERLLSSSPNAWLTALVQNLKTALSILRSDFKSGISSATHALELSEISGAAVNLSACLGNLGQLFFAVGELDRAVLFCERSGEVIPSNREKRNANLDNIARIRLLQGKTAECAELLDRIDSSIVNDDDQVLYSQRYSQLTRAQLKAYEGHWAEAIRQCDVTLRLADRAADSLLLKTTLLTKIELLQTLGESTVATQLLADVVGSGLSEPDLYAHYERIHACALARAGRMESARTHYDRAKRIYTSLQYVPGLIELERHWSAAVAHHAESAPISSSESVTDPHSAEKSVVHAIASIMLHGGRPELVACEIVDLLGATGAVHSATALARAADGSIEPLAHAGEPRDDAHASTDERCLTVGSARERTVEVRVRPRNDIESATTVNAVVLLLATVHDLERARAEREEHATLWPIDELPMDDDAAVATGHMREMMSFAKKIANTNVSVLITGESGTGKEVVARAIHTYSSRAQKPFIPFNCTAVPRELLESQLFGHRRGSFTGAERDNPGVIRSARDGTLFLDEIGELGLDLQPKLLRFLESGEICPLGESTPFTVNVRIVAATNSNLEALVREGRFREDLFYRINVIRLSLKPLRERRDEIPILISHFVMRAAEEFRKGHIRVSEEAIERLVLYPWPGNVRQLQNELRRMVALAEPNSVLEPTAIAREILGATPARPLGASAANGRELAVPLTDKLMPTLSRIEREMIKVALRDHQGRVDAAAKALGISRKGLYLKRQRLGL
jgi:DNA-binding NtrC family response regulator/tetratricopeptide (TPR) repeat protein